MKKLTVLDGWLLVDWLTGYWLIAHRKRGRAQKAETQRRRGREGVEPQGHRGTEIASQFSWLTESSEGYRSLIRRVSA